MYPLERHRAKPETVSALPHAGSLPKDQQGPGQGVAKVSSQELHLGLPQAQQGLNPWTHHLLPLKMHISKKLESGAEPALKFRI